ncbi:PAS domain S-box protein [Paenibacillus filicis]|uniref:histidine kinase n=1 Tax=Paenibacillus gyeongsangnamensis TaxID=3388067 RepID=A0ABT4QG61_9BACL|nr:PAS domain S-box protein [Paenibacillus filicis]MCZ8515665.1 PAS domain S-box protein [Paenibacillus filicis]
MLIREYYENSFHFSPIGMVLVSVEGFFLAANPSACRLIGYSEEEILNVNYRDITHPDDWAAEDLILKRLLSGESDQYCWEKRYIHRLGYFVKAELLVTLIRTAEGSPSYYIGYLKEAQHLETAEIQVKEAELLYNLISEHTKDIITYNLDGRIQYLSPSVKTLLGYNPKELLGGYWFELVHPDDLIWLKQRDFSPEDIFICRIRHKDGHYLWFETTLRMVEISSNEANKMFCISRDVTERYEAEQALRRSERSLAQAQQIASIGSWHYDMTTKRLHGSEELFHIFGLEPNGLEDVLHALLERVHPDDRERLDQELRQSLGLRELSAECRLLLPGDIVKSIRIQGVATFDSGERLLSLHGTVQDISEQKRMLQMLEESVDRYTSLKRYNLDAVISLSLQGAITSVNPAAERMTGYLGSELIGIHMTELQYGDNRMFSGTLLHQLLNEGVMSSTELQLRHREGYPLDILATPVPIYIFGRMVGCYIIAKDITDQKRKDELLRKSEKLSIAGQLAAGIAHEIRNPLTALKGFVHLMSHSESYVQRFLPIMKEELERIELIISELLMLAKPQATQMKRVDLGLLLKEVLVLIDAQAILQNIVLEPNIRESYCYIQCDPNQIKQIFINFIKNAIEAMPQGGMIGVEMGVQDEREIRVRITDQGCGISEAQLRLLGEPFYSTKEAGTGLGMLVSYKIIEHHGGRIRIESSVGHGTTIEVFLPLAGFS